MSMEHHKRVGWRSLRKRRDHAQNGAIDQYAPHHEHHVFKTQETAPVELTVASTSEFRAAPHQSRRLDCFTPSTIAADA